MSELPLRTDHFSPYEDASASDSNVSCGALESVVLVHGMLSDDRSMRKIGRVLIDDGFNVIHWNYPSLTQSIGVHAKNLGHHIRRLIQQDGIKRLHFVGHSMGCIIIRAALNLTSLPLETRIVMLAPPNSGSRLTRLPMGPFARFFPQLGELSESPESFVNRLPEPSGVAVGILAAGRDRVVDLQSTYLSTQRDHRVIDTSHQRLPLNDEAVFQVHQFLKDGQFNHCDSCQRSSLMAA